MRKTPTRGRFSAGLLAVGMKADINLIDLDAVGEGLPYMVQVRSQCYVHARPETTHRGKKEIK